MVKPTILVVDDSPENIQVLTAVLHTEFRVKAALNGERALKIAASSPSPELILLDIMMPDMDGYEVIDQLKSDPATAHIPVIFVTAMTQEVDEEKGLNLGAVDYITKPISPVIVLARVKTHLALHRQSRELEISYKKLQQMELLRDNLVHMLVHDMRTPVSVMEMSLSLLKDDIGNDLNVENQLDLDDALNGTKKLIKMINDLLDVSRMESGKMPLQRVRTNVVRIAEDAIAQVRKLAEEINLSLDTEHEEILVACDPEIIIRVILNFLHNALKFTPAGGSVTVTITIKDGSVKVAVADTGPGIPDEFQDHVFDKFGQTREARQYLSSGLGLTFCKLAIDSHQGEIGVESEPGKGSRFWFSLPLTPVEVDIETERTDEQ